MDPRYPNLTPWKKGQSGNPDGRRATSLTRLLREAMARTELCGQATPDGKLVEVAFVEACIAHAIKGNASYASQIWDRMEGNVSQPSTVVAFDASKMTDDEILARLASVAGGVATSGPDDPTGDAGETQGDDDGASGEA